MRGYVTAERGVCQWQYGLAISFRIFMVFEFVRSQALKGWQRVYQEIELLVCPPHLHSRFRDAFRCRNSFGTGAVLAARILHYLHAHAHVRVNRMETNRRL